MESETKVNILLVDDRQENLLTLQAVLEREELRLIKADTGEEALACLLKYDFALILLNVQMPAMNGFETAKIIKARSRSRHVPIIFISEHHLEPEYIYRGYALGAVDYLAMPFDPLILKAKAEKFIELYLSTQRLLCQANSLAEQTRELEKANAELSVMSAELRESEALANVIIESSIDSMIVMNETGLILKVNPAVETMFHYSEKELLNANIRLLFPYEQLDKNFPEAVGRIGNRQPKEVVAVRKGGSNFPAEIQIGTRFLRDKSIVAWTIRDITHQKRSEQMITHMAYHDGLTDLPNRSLFNDQLQIKLLQSKQKNQPMALLYLDIDRFKYINDSLGHLIGDMLLKQISKRLQASIRKDDFIARIGGDEFNVVLSNTNREKAIAVAESIMESFKQPFFIDSYELFMTASIGLSIFPYDGEEVHSLMKSADAALYRAKEQGINNLRLYHSGMNILSYRAFVLQNDLRKAIDRDELSLYYQPRLDLETNQIISAEALIRWHHPNWGMVLPAEFIQLAEESGLIVDIGDWVLKTVCAQIRKWRDADFPKFKVAVNFSALQFLQKDFLERIREQLNDAGIAPEELDMEITESTIVKNKEGVTNIISQIRKMGISVSIDDFGAGYSSLNDLRKFPKDTLKIDKSIIQSLSEHAAESVSMVSAIIALAGSLNMSVIAEGVETEEQLNILNRVGCKAIQGYFFCPPVPLDELETFIKNYKKQGKVTKHGRFLPPNNGPVVYGNNKQFSDKNMDLNQTIIKRAIMQTKERYAISARETEVFELLVEGLSNKEISEKLFISEHTVKNHITRIFQKLNVSDRVQAMSYVNQACMEESQKLRM